MMDLTPLDVSTLSAAAQRALGPGPGRAMASKGMLPLPPADQVAVLYQLTLDDDASIAGGARATAMGLPEKLLAGTLADPAIDPRILHLFGQLVGDRHAAVFDAIALSAAVADSTLAMLAAKGDARGIDQLAQNEQRLLRHPEIIAAMYMNRKARMSTIDRVVELAVRNEVRVPGLAAWDEVARALTNTPLSSPADDDAFASAMDEVSGDDSELTAGDAEDLDPEAEIEDSAQSDADTPYSKMTIPQKVRYATLGNAVARGLAIRDPVRMVSIAAIKSPGVTEIEAGRYAGNPAMSDDVIRFIASKREWTKITTVRYALCRNPKTPIPDAMRLMPFLREKELAQISKSRGVPSAVVAQAKKLINQRKGGQKR